MRMAVSRLYGERTFVSETFHTPEFHIAMIFLSHDFIAS